MLFGAVTTAQASEEGLIEHMGKFQYFAHKLGLAIDSGNGELQHFYAHELEEQIEEASKIETFDGIAIGELVTQLLLPKFRALETAVDSGNREAIDTRYDEMLRSCNECHRAAQRPFIRIERRTDNPYLQSFGK